jgi:hypothetical protein
MPVALAPQPGGSVYVPMLADTPIIRPPHPACQPSSRLCSRQNSHIVSVEGCNTTSRPSESGEGRALAGSGTSSQAACSRALRGGAGFGRATLTVGWSPGTV